MNPLLSGLMIGRSLSEGDYLGALPAIPDLIASLKAAATSALKTKAQAAISKVETKYLTGPTSSAPDVVQGSGMTTWPVWVKPAIGAAAVIVLVMVMKRRKGRR
jgi:hypothetical protein